MRKILILAVCMLAIAPFARAHVVLEQPEAPADSYYKATFRVGHGCEGKPTVAVTVFIPDHVVSIRPQPKPGWQMETTREQLAVPYTLHGKTFTEGVTRVRWSGGELPDAWFDEFSLMSRLPHQAGKYRFRVLQECTEGVNDWREIPTGDQAWHDLKRPAPVLRVVPVESVHGH